jgi:DNA-binding NtrC family response regulator
LGFDPSFLAGSVVLFAFAAREPARRGGEAAPALVREWSTAVRILILEDDPFIALDLQAIVEGEGHVTSVCGSVAEARRWLDDDIDFALLDVDVRDGKSFEVASSFQDRRIPFAFVTGSRRSEIPAHLAGAGFVAKPFGEAAILKCLPGAPASGRLTDHPELRAQRTAL